MVGLNLEEDDLILIGIGLESSLSLMDFGLSKLGLKLQIHDIGLSKLGLKLHIHMAYLSF